MRRGKTKGNGKTKIHKVMLKEFKTLSDYKIKQEFSILFMQKYICNKDSAGILFSEIINMPTGFALTEYSQ